MQVDEAQLKAIFEEVDLDKDGKFNAIDFLEFLEKKGIKIPRKLLAGVD